MFNTIEEAISDIKKGKMIICLDDESRENEGDFIVSAELVTKEDINFILKKGRGILCTPLSESVAKNLKLSPMVKENTDLRKTAFTESVDWKDCSTGVSASERTSTIHKLASKDSVSSDFIRPGHLFPLIAKSGGVLRRAGHTEASVDLMKLSGLNDVAVICEIMNDDGTMARRDDLLKIAKEYDFKIITIKDLISYRRRHEVLIEEAGIIDFPNKYGDFKLHIFESKIDGSNHIALVKGVIDGNGPAMVRVHSECLTGDLFGSKRCDCGDQLSSALNMIENEKSGILLYMRQEGRGIGLVNKIKAYMLQDEGHDTISANQKLGFNADLREYGIGAQILKHLGIKKMNLITNNPQKIIGIEGFDLEILNRIPIEIEANEVNYNYLKTKRDKMGHLLGMLDLKKSKELK